MLVATEPLCAGHSPGHLAVAVSGVTQHHTTNLPFRVCEDRKYQAFFLSTNQNNMYLSVNHTCQLLVSLFVRCIYSRQKLLIWWHDEGSFAHCWSYILIYILSMYHSIRTSCRPEQLVIEQDGQRLYRTIMGPPSSSSMLRIGKWSRIMIQWSKWSECSTVARHKGAGLSCGAAAAGHLLGQCGQEPGASPVGDQPPHNCHHSYSQDTRAIVLYEDIY